MTGRRQRKRAAAAPPRLRAAIVGRVTDTSARRPVPRRVVAIDGLRGVAICLMIAYHFCFDLNWFGIIRANFGGDPFWLTARAIIVTMFLLLVGVSLVLAERAGGNTARYWRRIALVGVCAILISAASYIAFPATFIAFGILHCIVVASLIAAPAVDSPRLALVAGAAILVIGLTAHSPVFDMRWLNWIGLMTHRPATEDYVPLFPWLGVVFVGIALGNALAVRDFRSLDAVSRMSPAWLKWLGRHSLLIYMVHQPILIGLLRTLPG